MYHQCAPDENVERESFPQRRTGLDVVMHVILLRKKKRINWNKVAQYFILENKNNLLV